MMKTKTVAAFLLCLLLLAGVGSANDDGATVPYYRSSAFNVPILEGWAMQTGADFAQFELAEARAIIRTASVTAADGVAAARGELSGLLGRDIGQPVYSDKVNLSDGTWHVLVFDVDEAITASSMARRNDSGFIVISLIERNPASRTVLLTMAQADDTLADASPEIVRAAMTIAGIDLSDLAPAEVTTLPSGEWIIYRSAGITAMGLVFGNESYVALQAGQPGDLATLADAYNRTLLGFFITPDNTRYLVLGLAAVFLTLGTLIFSFGWRERGLRQDMALIQQLAQADD